MDPRDVAAVLAAVLAGRQVRAERPRYPEEVVYQRDPAATYGGEMVVEDVTVSPDHSVWLQGDNTPIRVDHPQEFTWTVGGEVRPGSGAPAAPPPQQPGRPPVSEGAARPAARDAVEHMILTATGFEGEGRFWQEWSVPGDDSHTGEQVLAQAVERVAGRSHLVSQASVRGVEGVWVVRMEWWV